MESRAGLRLLVVDEGAPITPLHAEDYLERLPWLTDLEPRRSIRRDGSSLMLWPLTGAIFVALLSYFAAQASFAQAEQGQRQGQLTVMLPAPRPYHAHRMADLSEEASRQAEARYLAHVAYELQQLESDHSHPGK